MVDAVISANSGETLVISTEVLEDSFEFVVMSPYTGDESEPNTVVNGIVKGDFEAGLIIEPESQHVLRAIGADSDLRHKELGEVTEVRTV